MIYIFSGFQHICSLPGYCCQGIGTLCKSCPGVCKVVSDPFRNLCTNCGSYTKQFFEMPLSVYVLVSFLVSGYVGFMAQSGMTTKDKKSCTSNFLFALMGFAVVNIIFSIYVQCKVWAQIASDENKEEIDKYTAEVNQHSKGGGYLAAGKGLLNDAKAKVGGQQAEEAPPDVPAQEGKRIVPAKIVQDSFKKVFCEDLVVLVMFFALVGMAVLAGMGPKTLDGPDSEAGVCKVEDGTKTCGYYFLIVASLWSFAYMCCSCCSNKVTLAEEPKDDDM